LLVVSRVVLNVISDAKVKRKVELLSSITIVVTRDAIVITRDIVVLLKM